MLIAQRLDMNCHSIFFKHRKTVNFAEKSETLLDAQMLACDFFFSIFSVTYKLVASILRSLIGRVVSSALISKKKNDKNGRQKKISIKI